MTVGSHDGQGCVGMEEELAIFKSTKNVPQNSQYRKFLEVVYVGDSFKTQHSSCVCGVSLSLEEGKMEIGNNVGVLCMLGEKFTGAPGWVGEGQTRFVGL